MKKKKEIFHQYEIGDPKSWSFRVKLFISTDFRVLIVLKGLSGDEITITGDMDTAQRKLIELMQVLLKTSEELEEVQRYIAKNHPT